MKGVSGFISSELVPEACQCHLPLGGYNRYVHQVAEHWQIQKDKAGYHFNCYKEIELILQHIIIVHILLYIESAKNSLKL